MKILILCLSLIWLSLSGLVNFVVIPSVFSVVNDFFSAGNLGVTVFTKFNRFEFLFGSALVVLTLLDFKRTRSGLIAVLVSLLLLLISGSYLFYLTPKLSQLTTAWEYAQTMGTIGSAESDLQSLHMMYHRTYIVMDTVKLLLLLALVILMALPLFRKSR
jgi:hypothetical protein